MTDEKPIVSTTFAPPPVASRIAVPRSGAGFGSTIVPTPRAHSPSALPPPRITAAIHAPAPSAIIRADRATPLAPRTRTVSPTPIGRASITAFQAVIQAQGR